MRVSRAFSFLLVGEVDGGSSVDDVSTNPALSLQASKKSVLIHLSSSLFKSTVEIAGFHSAHVRDGIALVRYFSWLERRLASDEREGKGDGGVTEWEGAEVLEGFRSYVFSLLSLIDV